MKREVYEAMKTRLAVKEILLHVWYVKAATHSSTDG